MTIELPETLSTELAALFPASERDDFAVAAAADAVLARRQQIASGGAAFTEEHECHQAVEEALVEMDAGCGLVSFEEESRRWEAQKAVRRAQSQ